MCALQGQPYSCQGTSYKNTPGPTFSVNSGCGVKKQYPTYILGKVRFVDGAARANMVGIQQSMQRKSLSTTEPVIYKVGKNQIVSDSGLDLPVRSWVKQQSTVEPALGPGLQLKLEVGLGVI